MELESVDLAEVDLVFGKTNRIINISQKSYAISWYKNWLKLKKELYQNDETMDWRTCHHLNEHGNYQLQKLINKRYRHPSAMNINKGPLIDVNDHWSSLLVSCDLIKSSRQPKNRVVLLFKSSFPVKDSKFDVYIGNLLNQDPKHNFVITSLILEWWLCVKMKLFPFMWEYDKSCVELSCEEMIAYYDMWSRRNNHNYLSSLKTLFCGSSKCVSLFTQIAFIHFFETSDARKEIISSTIGVHWNKYKHDTMKMLYEHGYDNSNAFHSILMPSRFPIFCRNNLVFKKSYLMLNRNILKEYISISLPIIDGILDDYKSTFDKNKVRWLSVLSAICTIYNVNKWEIERITDFVNLYYTHGSIDKKREFKALYEKLKGGLGLLILKTLMFEYTETRCNFSLELPGRYHYPQKVCLLKRFDNRPNSYATWFVNCDVCNDIRSNICQYKKIGASSLRTVTASMISGFDNVINDIFEDTIYCGRKGGKTAAICNVTPCHIQSIFGKIKFYNDRYYLICPTCSNITDIDSHLTVCNSIGMVCRKCAEQYI
jgi:hypothetical protein